MSANDSRERCPYLLPTSRDKRSKIFNKHTSLKTRTRRRRYFSLRRSFIRRGVPRFTDFVRSRVLRVITNNNNNTQPYGVTFYVYFVSPFTETHQVVFPRAMIYADGFRRFPPVDISLRISDRTFGACTSFLK